MNAQGMTRGRMFSLGILGVVLIVGIALSFEVMENVDADEIVVIQAPISGDLSWFTTAGLKAQWFGTVTRYPKRDMYDFNIPVRFNDGGHGNMIGSVQYEYPLDKENLTSLHVRFGSAEAVKKQLIQTVTDKSVYMTGPLMSSKESYAEKRNYLISYVEDQIAHGVFKTLSREAKTTDQMTGAEKTITVVEVVMKDGIPQRQEEAVLASFGLRTFNFSINQLPYDSAVEFQIKQQQQIAMDVQTAIADAKKAEQRAITVAEQGKADAAKAKWEQEVIKAKAVTEAQQKLEVAELDRQEAEQYKQAQILRAEGDASYKKKVMEADGALAQKLEAYVQVNERYAQAMEKYQGAWVPNIVMGGNGAPSSSGAQDLINLFTAKAAKDLSLNLGVQTTTSQKP